MSRDLERRGRDPHEDLKKEGSWQGEQQVQRPGGGEQVGKCEDQPEGW